MFSVIIPNYNREGPIIRAIHSVLNQTFEDFELIIVDDCSTDSSLLEISKIKDSRIRVLKLDKNSGAAAARNFGIKKAVGPFISFLDSDDYYDPDFLKASFEKFSDLSPRVGFIWTGVKYCQNNNSKNFTWIPKRKSTPYQTFLHAHHIGTNSGITIRKNVFEICGMFREDLPAAEDTEFFLRITNHFDFDYVDKILVNIEKDSKDRLSKNFAKIGKAYNIFLKDHFHSIDQKETLQKKYYYKMMWLNYNLNDKNRARNFYKKIPEGVVTQKIKIVKILYEVLPLKTASYIHKTLSF